MNEGLLNFIYDSGEGKGVDGLGMPGSRGGTKLNADQKGANKAPESLNNDPRTIEEQPQLPDGPGTTDINTFHSGWPCKIRLPHTLWCCTPSNRKL